MTLFDKIKARTPGLLFFGITPPKKSTDPLKVEEITARTKERIRSIGPDGLILYDIQDEQSRTAEARPFPYLETIDSYLYADTMLQGLDIPKIVYRASGKYTKDEFSCWLAQVDTARVGSVFVGSPSRNDASAMNLQDAYEIRKDVNSALSIGGVLIPERHETKRNEHLRMIAKQSQGCSFFVTQCVYNAESAKNLLSDYYFTAKERGIDPVPVIFTLTTCGSAQTLDFMKWLGIQIPRWLENELKHSGDILAKSVEICRAIADELCGFCASYNIPFGINVESVSIRKQEIDASVELAKDMRAMLVRITK